MAIDKEKVNNFLSNYEYDKVSHYKPKHSDILIINNCSKSKDKAEGLMKAIDRYKGTEIKYIHDIKEITDFDHYIISAKYGLISEDEMIPYYNMTFKDLTKTEIKSIADDLHIREDLDRLLEKNKYKLVIFILADPYLNALNIDKSFNVRVFSFKTKNSKNIVKGTETINIDVNPKLNIKKFKKYIGINLKSGIIKELFKSYPNLEFVDDLNMIKDFVDNYKLD